MLGGASLDPISEACLAVLSRLNSSFYDDMDWRAWYSSAAILLFCLRKLFAICFKNL